jgi:hypothetical protein
MNPGKLSIVPRHCRTLANVGATLLTIVGPPRQRPLMVARLRSGRITGKPEVIVCPSYWYRQKTLALYRMRVLGEE